MYKFKKVPMPAESGLEELSTKLSKFNVSIREYAQSFQEESHQSSRHDSFSILCTHILCASTHNYITCKGK